jgi:hypothetical protein
MASDEKKLKDSARSAQIDAVVELVCQVREAYSAFGWCSNNVADI